jgi:hypothetical protein
LDIEFYLIDLSQFWTEFSFKQLTVFTTWLQGNSISGRWVPL